MEELKSRFKSLLFGLGLAFALFTFARFVFLIFNLDSFASNSVFDIFFAFVFGVWFDTVPVFYYNLLFILCLIIPHKVLYRNPFQYILIAIFLFTNGIALAQNLTDVAYFPFNKKRTGAEIFHLSKEWSSEQLIAYATDFWYLFPFLILGLFVSFKILKKHFQNRPVIAEVLFYNMNIIFNIIHVIFWIGITLLGLRGGFGLIPLRTFDASRYVNTSLVPLTINTPFQLICTIEGNDAPSFDFMTEQEADAILGPKKQTQNRSINKSNVVIIIVESLGKEYMGFYNEGKGFTPFLDSLCKVSLTFEHSFANGTTSMDAPPAIFAGIPNLMEDSYIISQFNINTPQSIGSILKEKGYDGSFYHGGKNGTMGFDNFIAQCGMGSYFGLDEYPTKSDFDGKWGIFDEPYLQYYAKELSKKQTPFISSVFTLSSHHPYTIQKQYKNQLPVGKLPIHQSIAYVDLALKRFFETASKQAWYQNTLFIITADHTSDSDNPKYQTPLGRYAIPFIFFSPNKKLPIEVRQNVMQQSLLLPTVLDYLHVENPVSNLNNSVFDSKVESFGIFYANGTYSLAQGNYVLTLSQDGKTHIFDRKNDPYYQTELSCLEEKIKMELLLKAYLQSYFFKIKNNSLIK